MVDKNEFKEKTDTKQKLVAADDHFCESDEIGSGEPSALPSENDKPLAATDDVSSTTTEDAPAAANDEAASTAKAAAPSAGTDEVRLREQCLRDLTSPLKKFTERITAHVMEHSEEVNTASAVGIAAAFSLILLLTIAVVLTKEGSNFHAADLKRIWWVFAPMVPIVGMCLGGISLPGRWLWLHGYYRLARLCFYIGSVPARLLPHGILNSHLAARSLCALYLTQGLPLKAQAVSTQFSRAILTPEGTALSDSLKAEAAAKAGQTKLAAEYAQRALNGFEHVGVEPYIKARLGRELFNHVGNCYFALGECKKARESYLRALHETLSADQIDHVSLIVAIINTARASTAAGYNEQAQNWLEILRDDNNLSMKVPAAMKGELLLARAESMLASDNEEKQNEGLSLLELADEEFRKRNVYPDMGSAAHQLGKLSAEREENAKAEAYFRRALKVKLRALPESHPSVGETRQELVNLLRSLGKTKDAGVEMSMFTEAPADDEQESLAEFDSNVRDRDPLAVGKKIREHAVQRQCWILGGMALYFSWQLITSGIRAADPSCWVLLALWIAFSGLLIGLRLNAKKQEASLKQKASQQKSIVSTVTFKRNTRPDNMGLAFIAVLGEPINRECIVQKDFYLVETNLAYYARPQKLSVYMDGESPVSIELPDGMVKLAPDKSLKEMYTQQSNSTARALLLGGVVAMFALGLGIWSCTLIDHEKTPTGLTAFEYYRYGAHEIQNDWSGKPRFNDLEKVKKCLDRAIELDKSGIIGKLASRCENAEMPRAIPNREILERYEDGVSGSLTDAEKEQRLRSCIKVVPDFDWAYCSLAEHLINQNKLQEAEKLLELASKINPNSNMYLLTRAQLCRKTGNVKQAIVLIKKAIDNDPFLLSTHQALISTTLGL